MHAFFVRELPKPGVSIELDKPERVHLFKILRAAPGDQVKLLDGTGGVAIASVDERESLTVTSAEKTAPPRVKYHLYVAAPRRQKLDQLLKQATELGVWSIRLIDCEFSVAHPDKSERHGLLCQEACKQSGNPFLPDLKLGLDFNSAIKEVVDNGYWGCFGAIAEEEETGSLALADDIALFIGPEGGFSPGELATFQQKGFAPINFGPYILRLETAAIAGVAVLRRIRGNG